MPEAQGAVEPAASDAPIVGQEPGQEPDTRRPASAGYDDFRLSENRFRLLFDANPVGQVELSPEGVVQRVNQAFAELVGLNDPSLLIGRTPAWATAELDRPAQEQTLLIAAAEPGRVLHTERTVMRADGTSIEIAGTLVGVPGSDGKTAVLIASAVDVSERNRDARRLAELAAQVATQAEFTRVLLETAHAAIWSCDTTGRPTYVNPIARQFLGLPTPSDESVVVDEGAHTALIHGVRLLHSDGTAMTLQQMPLQRALSGEERVDTEVVLEVADQPPRTLLMYASPLRDSEGNVTGAVSTGHDITALRASEARFRAAFHDGPTPLARLDREGIVQEINPAMRRLSGRRTSALVGQPLRDQVHPDDRRRLARVVAGAGTGSDPVELRIMRADGIPVWCEMATTVSTDVDGGTSVLAQFLDVDARKTQELMLEQAAQHDALTGLGNRSLLLARIEAFADAGSELTPGLLFLDLDNFKAVNDEHGHDAGDAVLVEVAGRLLTAVRPDDTVIRLGGDEFVIVCPLPPDTADSLLRALARRIEHAIAAPVQFRTRQLHVGVSVGVATAAPGQSPQELLESADRSMYERKRARVTAPKAR